VRGASRPPRVLVILSGVTAFIAVAPLVYLLIRVSDAGPARIWATLVRPRTLETVGTSVGLVLVVVLGCLIIGVPTAWLISRTNIPLGRMWWVLVALPLAIPSYVAAYAWIAQFPGMRGFWAAAFLLALVSSPYVVIPVAASMRSVDPAMEEVARTLGNGPVKAFMRTTVPHVWPATAAGSLLVALYTLSDFGAVSIFRVDAFTRVIYASYRASFDRVSAAVLALVLVALAATLVLAERRIRGRAQRWRVATGTARPALPFVLTGGRRVAGIAWLTFWGVLALGVPITSLILQLIQGSSAPVRWSDLLQATVNSAGVSAIGAVIAVGLALSVGVLAARYRTTGSRFFEAVSYSGHALPGVVVGLSLVFLTLSVFPAIYQTVFTLALAYAILFLPKSIGATRSSVAHVPPILEQTARTLGRGPLRAWIDTTLRLSWTGIAAGGLLVLLTAMKELPATLMLRPTGLDTLATQLWSRTEIAAYGAAAPYALALIALAAVPAWLLSIAATSRKEQQEGDEVERPLSTVHA
jgi:iron(III) transport system permease protein